MSFFDEITGADGVAVLDFAGRAQARSRRGERADPDRDAVGLAEAGAHAAALRLLMKRHGGSVLRYCREALRDPALADDVHQQVFIHVARALPRFRGEAQVRTWLFTIARNRVLDAAKIRRRTSARFAAMPPAAWTAACEDAVDPAPPPGRAIDDRRLVEALVDCVRDLDEPVRTALLLRYQQGFTFEAMAEICGEKAGTLAARVSRALPVLRARIEARFGASLRR